jgi:hypothetical protein
MQMGWLADAVADFEQAKSGAGRSAVYLKDIRYRLRGFAKAFNLEVRDLVAKDVADYLEGLKLQSRGFNNHVSMLRTFFGFCQARAGLQNTRTFSHASKGVRGQVRRSRFSRRKNCESFSPLHPLV